MVRCHILCFALLSLLASIGPAHEREEKRQVHAVLIGIDNCTDRQILPHPQAEADIAALYDLLIAPDYFSIDPERIRLLLGNADAKRHSMPATREQIVAALHWVTQRAKPEDLVLFAFSGQGAPLGRSTCYFAADSTFAARERDAIPAQLIGSEMEKLPCRSLCALLDVHFQGFDPGKGGRPELFEEEVGKEFLRRPARPFGIGRVALLSGNGWTPPQAMEGRGAFSRLVLEGLRGAAGHAEGQVTARELADYLMAKLPELTRKQQVPRVLTAGWTSFVLTQKAADRVRVQRRIERLERLVSEKAIDAELFAEGTDLLRRLPRPETARALRKQYLDLIDGGLAVQEFLAARAKLLQQCKLDKVEAINFGTQLAQAVEVVARRYYRELNEAELLAWGVEGLYQAAEEPIPDALRTKLEKLGEQEFIKQLEVLVEARERLGRRTDLDDRKDIEQAIAHMLGRLDRYSILMNRAAMAHLRWQANSDALGEIGALVRLDPAGESLDVVTPFLNGAAHRAGVRAGDRIVQMKILDDDAGEPLETASVVGPRDWKDQHLDRLLRGKPGSRIELTLLHPGSSEPQVIALKRAALKKEKIVGVRRLADGTWDHLLDPAQRVYYVRITDFHAPNTAQELGRLLTDLERKGLGGLVLDLRFNSGGLIDTAVDVADLFIDDGAIVEFRSRDHPPVRRLGKRPGSHLGFPLACLINPVSGSSTEIVASCLQDHQRAVLVGERTFGKGSIQNYYPVDSGTLRISTAHAYRPSDKGLERLTPQGGESESWGVSPDSGYVLEMSREERNHLREHLLDRLTLPPRTPGPERANFKDRQLEAALKFLQEKVRR